LQRLKNYLLALVTSLSIITLLKALWEQSLLFSHPAPPRTSHPSSAAHPPASHRNDKIRVRSLAEKYLPGHNQHAPHAPPRRLIIVGDVHGCKTELVALLDKVQYARASDHLILAGDFINKGADSRGVVALARELHASCVRGNHEDKLLKALQEGSAGAIADPKLARLARELGGEDVAFLERCPHLLTLGRLAGLPFADTVVVHGGLEPGVTLQRQDAFAVMNMRAIDPATGRPEARRQDGVAWWRVWNKAQRKLPKAERVLVVYGHDSKQGLVEKEYSVGLDSGCVNGARLSALVIDERLRDGMKVVSVKSHVKD